MIADCTTTTNRRTNTAVNATPTTAKVDDIQNAQQNTYQSTKLRYGVPM